MKNQHIYIQGNWETFLIYHHSDHLGSTSVDTDDNGDIVQIVDYYPYGDTRLSEQPQGINNPYKYNGKELDEDTGLYYYGARYYNAKIGRFVSQDPWGGDLKDPQSLNKYAYVRNNPMKYVDPTGMFNVETGEVEDGDTLESITSILNDEYGITLTKSKVAEVNGIENDEITVGAFLILPKQELVLIFDNKYLRAYDINYRTYFWDLIWEAVSGKDNKYDPIPEGIWRIDPNNTEYYNDLSIIQKVASLINKGLWPGGITAWGNVRTQMQNLGTNEIESGYYIHGGLSPGSAGCIDLTSDNNSFHEWFTNSWGKSIDVVVNYSELSKLL